MRLGGPSAARANGPGRPRRALCCRRRAAPEPLARATAFEYNHRHAAADHRLRILHIHLEITTGADGPLLSNSRYALITGEYYRLNVTSDGVETWRLEVDDLLRNSHLRIVTINGIEVHLQALAFRGIEFDVGGTAQFSFTPIRTGTFEFTVGDTPAARRRRADGGRSAVGTFTVE